MSDSLYPLRFEPVYQRYIWGGRRLATLLGRRLEAAGVYAESWDVCDHEENQSVVESGPLAGTTLHELLTDRGEELLGPGHDQDQAPRSPKRFPLILKYLDATGRLSLQVHPDDEMAAKLDPPDLGKAEAWVVLAAEPGSTIYAGLKPGVDREKLARAISQRTCRECLHQFQPAVGDCVYLPAGTVHALGEGLLVAEIQQASNTTFRLFDWDRLRPGAKPRQLHVDEALEAINYHQGPVELQRPQPTDRRGVSRLVECDKFVLERWEFSWPQAAGGDQRCHIITVLQGAVSVQGDQAAGPLPRGRTVLLPAAVGEVQISPHDRAILLDVCLPE